MKVILRQDFESLGKIGEVVAVKDGYARNYLIPRSIGTAQPQAAFARSMRKSVSTSGRNRNH